MKIDIPGVNFLICNNQFCSYNNPNTRTCSYDARIVLNENGRCEILPQGNQPKRKRYKIKGRIKKENFKPIAKIYLSDEDIKKIVDGAERSIEILPSNKGSVTNSPPMDKFYYMSSGYQPKDSSNVAPNPPKTGSDLNVPHWYIDEKGRAVEEWSDGTTKFLY